MITDVEYPPLINGHGKRFKCTIILRLCHHVFKHEMDRVKYLIPLTNVNSIQAHQSINLSSFYLPRLLTPLAPATVVHKLIALASDDDMASAMHAIGKTSENCYASSTKTEQEVETGAMMIQNG